MWEIKRTAIVGGDGKVLNVERLAVWILAPTPPSFHVTAQAPRIHAGSSDFPLRQGPTRPENPW